MKKIMIVSEIFAPQNRIAAVRLTKIAKYIFNNCNCEITVITRDKTFELIDNILLNDSKCVKRYIKVKEGKLLSKINYWREKRVKRKLANPPKDISFNSYSKKKNNSKRNIWIINLMRTLLDILNNWSYFRNAKKKINSLNIEYDVILSSFGPYSSHFIGRYLKRKNPSSYWIADFRDPVLNDLTPFILRIYMKSFANRICRQADIITAVSRGVMENLFIFENKDKKIITNGYDREDITKLSITEENTSILRFIYVGRLYPGKSNLRPIFKAIKDLISENSIIKERIEIVYAGPSQKEFIFQINQYGLLNCVKSYSWVKREKSLQLQMMSNILLLASWNNRGSTGILTGKFFEYMLMNKPIICSMSGGLSNSNIAEIINAANIGFCYEEVNSFYDYLELKNYILKQYIQIMNKSTVIFNPNYNYIEKYDYNNIAKQIISLFTEN